MIEQERKRNTLEMYADVLEYCLQERKKTHILMHLRMNGTQCKAVLLPLIKLEYIACSSDGEISTNNRLYNAGYTTTIRGREALSILREINAARLNIC